MGNGALLSGSEREKENENVYSGAVSEMSSKIFGGGGGGVTYEETVW